MHGHSSSPPATFAGGAPGADRVPPQRVGLRRSLCGAALLAAASGTAFAYTATLTPAAPQTVYLQVGVGSFTANYNAGGQPQNNTTINVVSTTLAAAALGNSTAQAMTTNSSAANSFLDGYLFCNVPGQLYIGGFYRTTGAATAAAQVVATVPAALTNATGGTIPFSKVAWTSGGNGPGNATEPFLAGTFVNGGTQNVGSMASNTWNESCWTFSYLNNIVPQAGTFSGRVLYTLSAP